MIMPILWIHWHWYSLPKMHDDHRINSNGFLCLSLRARSNFWTTVFETYCSEYLVSNLIAHLCNFSTPKSHGVSSVFSQSFLYSSCHLGYARPSFVGFGLRCWSTFGTPQAVAVLLFCSFQCPLLQDYVQAMSLTCRWFATCETWYT